MERRYERNRSDFWISVHENEGAYHISTKAKYTNIINYFFPILEKRSPMKWKESKTYAGMYTLWLPEDRYDQDVMAEFLDWCEKVTGDVLWLGLNKNIKEYFFNEMDCCMALDFNIVYGQSRTEIGEAEYQLKYNAENLSKEEREKYVGLIRSKLLEGCGYIPFGSKADWYVSPMPAMESGRSKMAWKMAEDLSRQLNIPFLVPDLRSYKPEMKQLSVEEKIRIWEEKYANREVVLSHSVKRKKILMVDDLYQSGTTMWKYAGFLKDEGADCVFGLVCVKSLKDSDNT